ncbi:MAG: LUD domain-containing protein [Rhodospirillaceae bacterium]|nr:LUD domain-containing protein [Rhodospirillaceae bacterium]
MTVLESRETVLSAIRATRRGDADSRTAAVGRRLADPPRGPGLSRVAVALANGRNLAEIFCDAVQASGAVALRVADDAAVIAAIRGLFVKYGLCGPVVRSDDPGFLPLDDLSEGVHIGAARPEDRVGIVRAYSGIAETGSVVLVSAPETPTTANFLPETHIVVVSARAIHVALDDALAALRVLPVQPRTVNLITGPSRTGDIELTLQVGVHGPRAVFVVVKDDD